MTVSRGRLLRTPVSWPPTIVATVALAILLALASACSASTEDDDGQETQRAAAEQTLGIHVVSVTLSAGGGLVDFRYQVIDPDKASVLGGLHDDGGSEDPEELLEDFKDRPLLVDEESGYAVIESHMHLMGRVTQQREQPKPGQTYFILFSNSGGLVEQGSKVSLVVGDVRVEHLVVQ